MPTILHLPADLLARLAYKYDAEGFPDGVVPNTEHAEVCMQVCKAWRDALAQPMHKWMRLRLIWSKQQVRLLQTLQLQSFRGPFAVLKANGAGAGVLTEQNLERANEMIAELPKAIAMIQDAYKFIRTTNEKLVWHGMQISDSLVVELLCELGDLDRDFLEFRKHFLPDEEETEADRVEIVDLFDQGTLEFVPQ